MLRRPGPGGLAASAALTLNAFTQILPGSPTGPFAPLGPFADTAAALVGTLGLLGLLAALGIAGSRLAGRCLTHPGPGAPARHSRTSSPGLASLAVAAFGFGAALAVILAMALGHMGWLHPAPFLLALAVLPWSLPRRWSAPLSGALWGQRLRSLISGGAPGASSGTEAPLGRRLAAARGLLSLAVVAFLALVSITSLRSHRYAPPGSFGLDDTSYHLTTVALWHERGDLATPKFSHGDKSTPYYPVGGELASWVLLAPFGDLDFASRWSQLPFALATLLALLALGRRLGLSLSGRLLAAAIFWSLLRVFPETALTAGNDHSTGFYTLAALDALLLLVGAGSLAARQALPRPGTARPETFSAGRRGAARGRPRGQGPGRSLPRWFGPTLGRALWAGVALGGLVGTKYLGVLFLPPLAAVALGALALRRLAAPAGRPTEAAPGGSAEGGEAGARRRSGWRSALVPLALVGLTLVAAATVTGGYTYLRNGASLGNPLFPAPVSVAGMELFEGWEGSSREARMAKDIAAIDLPGFFLRRDLFGPLGPWLLLPGALLAPLAALILGLALGNRLGFRRRSPAGESRPGRTRSSTTPGFFLRALVLSLPAGLFWIFLRLVADHRDVRYLFAAVALAALGTAWCVESLDRLKGRLAAVLGLVAVLAAWGGVVAQVVLELPERYGRPAAAPDPLLLGLGAFLLTGLVAWRWGSSWRSGRPEDRFRRRPWQVALAILGSVVVLGAVTHAARQYPERKLEHRPVAAVFGELAGSEGTTLAYVGHNTPYLLTGRRLENRVEIVPTTWNLEGRHFTWGGDDAIPYGVKGRFHRWWKNLRILGAEWVVVVRAGDERPEREWMVRRPGRFWRAWSQMDLDGHPVEIWQVLDPDRPAAERALAPGSGARSQSPNT